MRARSVLGPVAALLVALGLAGCVWDPYTQSYVPCCAYPYGYPYPVYASPGPARPGPPIAREPRLERQFAAANVTRDGKLTYAQARSARWHVVVRNFAAIDAGHKGFVTLGDIQAWFAATGRLPQ